MSQRGVQVAKTILTLVPPTLKGKEAIMAKWFSLITEFLDPRGHAFLLAKNAYKDGSMIRPDWITTAFPSKWMLKDVIVVERLEAEEPGPLSLAHRYDFLFWNVLSLSKYYFNLDAIRVPNVTGDKRNHPLGKNPGNVWLRASGPAASTLSDFHEDKNGDCEVDDGGTAVLGLEFVERILIGTMEREETVIDPLGTVPELNGIASEHGFRSLSLRLPHFEGESG